MPDREWENPEPPLNSFGTGGLSFDVANSRVTWTIWKSLVLGLVGLAVAVVGVVGENVGLVVCAGLLIATSLIWAWTFHRSQRDARRLEQKARADQLR